VLLTVQEKKVLERGSADEMDPEYQKKVYEVRMEIDCESRQFGMKI